MRLCDNAYIPLQFNFYVTYQERIRMCCEWRARAI